jgi:hypothetical protein
MKNGNKTIVLTRLERKRENGTRHRKELSLFVGGGESGRRVERVDLGMPCMRVVFFSIVCVCRMIIRVVLGEGPSKAAIP